MKCEGSRLQITRSEACPAIRVSKSDASFRSPRRRSAILSSMDAVTFTRQLVDIESISGNEAAVGNYLYGELCRLGYQTKKMPVEGNRFNVYATSPDASQSRLSFSPLTWIPSLLHSLLGGRGDASTAADRATPKASSPRRSPPLNACGAEGIHVGLSVRRRRRTRQPGRKSRERSAPASCKFLVNGEPTENRIALASKGTLRAEVTAKGRMAHSAYPELGESAIDKLIPALARLRAMPLPSEPEVGPCTLNIGLIEGGRAPNVIPDYAHADLLYRLVGPSDELRSQILADAGDRSRSRFRWNFPSSSLRTVDGLPTMIAAFTTDIPKLTNWGEPLLIGPGSIHVAHTEGRVHREAATARRHRPVLQDRKAAGQLMVGKFSALPGVAKQILRLLRKPPHTVGNRKPDDHHVHQQSQNEVVKFVRTPSVKCRERQNDQIHDFFHRSVIK